MVFVWIALGVLAGAFLGRLFGFMAAEFVFRPLLWIAQGVAYLLGWIVVWVKKLP